MGAKGFLLRLIRTAKTLARDDRIPKSLRWVAGIALLPIPGPVDEFLLVLIAPAFLLYRKAVAGGLGQRSRGRQFKLTHYHPAVPLHFVK